ncbi:MAG: hypothetical protein R3F46_13450 [bacterium]
MSTFAESISDYRELDAPLQRSMRRWWAGPGRLWLLAIAACGFVSVVSIALRNTVLFSSSSRSMIYISFGAYSGLNLLPILAMLHIAWQRHMVLTQFTDSFAAPNPRLIRQYDYVSGIISSWPFPASFLLVSFLQQLFMFFYVPDQLRSTSMILDWIAITSSRCIQLLILALICSLLLHLAGRTITFLVAASAILLELLLDPLRILPAYTQSLSRISHEIAADGALLAVGSAAALLLLFLIILSLTNSWKLPTLLAAITLLLLRIWQFACDFWMVLPTEQAAAGMWQFLRGLQLVFRWPPASYSMQTFTFHGGTNGAMLLLLFWNPELAIQTGPIGYLLAPLLNIVWLALVFLFCRWAVGRSTGREEG